MWVQMQSTEKEAVILEAYEALQDMQSARPAANALRDLCAEFGFTFYSVITLPETNEKKLQPAIISSNWPVALLHDYDRHELLKNSPIIESLRTSPRPVYWDLPSIIDKRGDDEGPVVSDLFARHSMTMGLYLPTYDSNGQKGAVSFNGNRTQPAAHEIAHLHLVSHFLFGQLQLALNPVEHRKSKLSPRELDCVVWAARGKTSSECATILGLAESTVAGYLNSAARKLNAANRPHLVAQAFRSGLIS